MLKNVAEGRREQEIYSISYFTQRGIIKHRVLAKSDTNHTFKKLVHSEESSFLVLGAVWLRSATTSTLFPSQSSKPS